MNNGCICCTVRGDLIAGLKKLHKQTTGKAERKSFVTAGGWMPQLVSRVRASLWMGSSLRPRALQIQLPWHRPSLLMTSLLPQRSHARERE